MFVQREREKREERMIVTWPLRWGPIRNCLFGMSQVVRERRSNGAHFGADFWGWFLGLMFGADFWGWGAVCFPFPEHPKVTLQTRDFDHCTYRTCSIVMVPDSSGSCGYLIGCISHVSERGNLISRKWSVENDQSDFGWARNGGESEMTNSHQICSKAVPLCSPEREECRRTTLVFVAWL